jgi:hypothetical protein
VKGYDNFLLNTQEVTERSFPAIKLESFLIERVLFEKNIEIFIDTVVKNYEKLDYVFNKRASSFAHRFIKAKLIDLIKNLSKKIVDNDSFFWHALKVCNENNKFKLNYVKNGLSLKKEFGGNQNECSFLVFPVKQELSADIFSFGDNVINIRGDEIIFSAPSRKKTNSKTIYKMSTKSVLITFSRTNSTLKVNIEGLFNLSIAEFFVNNRRLVNCFTNINANYFLYGESR